MDLIMLGMVNLLITIRKYCAFILALLPLLANSQEHIPEKYHHFQGDSWKQVCDIAFNKNGESFICGDFEESFTLNAEEYLAKGKRGHFISCMDSIGTIKWLKTFESSDYSSIAGLEVGQDGMIYLVGKFSDTLYFEEHSLFGRNQLFYIKLDTSGELSEFNVLLPDFNGYVKSFFLDTLNNFILAGDFRRDIKIGNDHFRSSGKRDIFFLRISQELVIEGINTFGGKGRDELIGICQQSNNELILYGNFEDKIDLIDTAIISKGKKDVFLLYGSSSGTFKNALAIGGRNNDEVQSVVSDITGNIYIAGQFKNTLVLDSNVLSSSGGNDIFLAHYSKYRKFKSVKTWGGAGNDRPMSLVVDRNLQLFLSGVYNKSIKFGEDTLQSNNRFSNGFLALYTERDGIKWLKDFKGDSEEIPRKLFLNGNARFLLSGTFLEDLQFDNRSLKSKGLSDAFLISYLDPCTLLKFNLPSEQTICLETDDTLHAGTGFLDYLWNNGLSQNESLIISDTGNYWVQITDQYGCKAIDTIHVRRDSLFLNYEVVDERMPEGNNGRIDLTYGGGMSPYSILWDNFEHSPSLENLQKGFYQVRITDANGCQINKEIEVGQELASGILDIYNFPNPMEDLTHIVYSLPENTSLEISLFDMTGKLVYVLLRGQKRKGKYEFDWNSGNLKNGVYYIRIQTPDGLVSKKIMISRNN